MIAGRAPGVVLASCWFIPGSHSSHYVWRIVRFIPALIGLTEVVASRSQPAACRGRSIRRLTLASPRLSSRCGNLRAVC